MFNLNLLKAKIIEKGLSVIDLCNAMGICETTFYRKLSREGDFSRVEIVKITETLGLSLDEPCRYRRRDRGRLRKRKKRRKIWKLSYCYFY